MSTLAVRRHPASLFPVADSDPKATERRVQVQSAN